MLAPKGTRCPRRAPLRWLCVGLGVDPRTEPPPVSQLQDGAEPPDFEVVEPPLAIFTTVVGVSAAIAWA